MVLSVEVSFCGERFEFVDRNPGKKVLLLFEASVFINIFSYLILYRSQAAWKDRLTNSTL